MIELRMDEAERLGGAIERSGIFQLQTVEQGTLIAIECYHRNCTPIDFNRTFHMMGGKPTMRADAMLAEFAKVGEVEFIEMTRTNCHIKGGLIGKKMYDWKLSMADAEAEELPFEVGKGNVVVVDAKGNKVIKHQWKVRPQSMLFARVVSNMIRKLAPAIVAGIYTPEEASDFEDAPRQAAPAMAVIASVAAPAPQATAPQPAPTPEPPAAPAQAAPAVVTPQPAAEPTAQATAVPVGLRMPAAPGLPEKLVGLRIPEELSPAQNKYFAEKGSQLPWWTAEYQAAALKGCQQ